MDFTFENKTTGGCRCRSCRFASTNRILQVISALLGRYCRIQTQHQTLYGQTYLLSVVYPGFHACPKGLQAQASDGVYFIQLANDLNFVSCISVLYNLGTLFYRNVKLYYHSLAWQKHQQLLLLLLILLLFLFFSGRFDLLCCELLNSICCSEVFGYFQ